MLYEYRKAKDPVAATDLHLPWRLRISNPHPQAAELGCCVCRASRTRGQGQERRRGVRRAAAVAGAGRPNAVGLHAARWGVGALPTDDPSWCGRGPTPRSTACGPASTRSPTCGLSARPRAHGRRGPSRRRRVFYPRGWAKGRGCEEAVGTRPAPLSEGGRRCLSRLRST